ncbi:hypothetical protein [Ruegeria atlantica]|nr:hypothetical protein [Ruegeria atlantica]
MISCLRERMGCGGWLQAVPGALEHTLILFLVSLFDRDAATQVAYRKLSP